MNADDFLEYDHFHDRPGRPRGPSLPWTSAGLALFWGGWIGLAIFGILFYIENETKSWPEIPGIVRSSATQRTATGDKLDFTYEFKVGGISYRSHSVNKSQNRVVGDWQTDPLNPAAIVAKYPPGSQVSVFYDPADPRDSVLEHGISRFTIFGLLAAGAGVILGFLVYIKRPFKEIDRQEAYERHTRPYG